MRKEIPAPVVADSSLTKVKDSIFHPQKKPVHKIIVIKKEEPVITKEEPVHFPTLEDLKEPVYTVPKIESVNKTPIKKKRNLAIPKVIVGSLLIIFGFVNTGAVVQMIAQYEGDLAKTMYIYPIGTVCMITGGILIYDTIRWRK
jgi:hypothetical protein